MLKYDTTFNTFQRLINNQSFVSNLDNYIDSNLSPVDVNCSDLLPNQYYFIVRTKEKELLSNRENEIVYYMFNNAINEEIAEKLCLSIHTVDSHRRNILKKLEIKNTMDLILNMILV